MTDLNNRLRSVLRCRPGDETPRSLLSFMGKTVVLSAKQVPSALSLRKMGSASISPNLQLLEEAGAEIDFYSEVGDKMSDADGESIPIREILVPSENKEKKKLPKQNVRLAYHDFFAVTAAKFLSDTQPSSENGSNPKGPRVLFWGADNVRLQDKISPNHFEWGEEKKPKKQIRFQDIRNVDTQIKFLQKKTHWGAYLHKIRVEKLSKHDNHIDSFWRRIRHLLEGKPDPLWTRDYTQKIWVSLEERNRRERSRRFIEVLKTIDGIFAQRFLAFPLEKWDWDRYDFFVVKHIWELISDEFYDGQLQQNAWMVDTRFSQLKKMRKTFKSTGGKSIQPVIKYLNQVTWLRWWIPAYQWYEDEKDFQRRTYLFGTLCQTRGTGKPPRILSLQTKIKFVKTTSIPDETKQEQIDLVSHAMSRILSGLPDHIFTGMSTKAILRVTESADFHHKVTEQGTLRSINSIISSRRHGVLAMTYNLETGEEEGLLSPDATLGTYVFWRCFEETMYLTPSERSELVLVIVDEPGKNRAVTKARACLKIVLDVVNKLCAFPLKKGFESSRSGMEASHHAWNMFKSFGDLNSDMLFDVFTSEQTSFDDFEEIIERYARVYVLSTDFETATDYLSHPIGSVIAHAWMLKCGIPGILRNLVCEIAFSSRKVQVFGDIGLGDYDRKTNSFTYHTTRGVMMGDPMTKVVLHFVNIITRYLGVQLYNPEFYSGIQVGFQSDLLREGLE